MAVRYATSFMSNIKKDTGTGLCTLLLGDLLSHDAKIPGNNLAWKDIGFMPDVEEEPKKNETYVENVVRNQ